MYILIWLVNKYTPAYLKFNMSIIALMLLLLFEDWNLHKRQFLNVYIISTSTYEKVLKFLF